MMHGKKIEREKGGINPYKYEGNSKNTRNCSIFY